MTDQARTAHCPGEVARRQGQGRCGQAGVSSRRPCTDFADNSEELRNVYSQWFGIATGSPAAQDAMTICLNAFISQVVDLLH